MLKEFFGFGGYTRTPEGYLSWQHLTFVTACIAVMIVLAVVLGRKNRGAERKQKLRVLSVVAVVLDLTEIGKIVLLCFREHNPMQWLYLLPLFLCSIQLITVPLAAFSRGRVQEAALDFVMIFGVLGAVLGMYGAGQNYGAYPVLSFDNVVSALTHTLSGFAAIYIGAAGLASMKRKNISVTYLILLFFCGAAYVANLLIPYNYMFLMRADGTPYEIVYRLTGGSPVFYPLAVVVLFLIYIALFYGIFFLFRRKKK